MQREFKRKANNYKQYKTFLYFALPLMILIALFPIVILFTQEMESDADVPMFIGVSVFFFALVGLAFYESKKQLKSKASYLNMMSVPILTLTDNHLIYKFDELEQYIIPWKQVARIELNEIPERFRSKLGSISISYKEDLAEYVKEVRRRSHLKDQIGDIVISIMYFEEELDEVYGAITEYSEKTIKE